MGIDFSMNSAAVCIERDNEIHFFVFPRSTTKNMDALLRDTNVHVHVIEKTKPDDYNSNIATRERFNTRDAMKVSTSMIDTLKDFLIGYDVQIGIEGIAFMSRGNAIAQFSGYHYILRAALSQITDLDNVVVFQPTTVKKHAGGGRFKKEDMIDAFMKVKSSQLQENDFYNRLVNSTDDFKSVRAKNFLKPVDDMVDSYYVLKCLDIS